MYFKTYIILEKSLPNIVGISSGDPNKLSLSRMRMKSANSGPWLLARKNSFLFAFCLNTANRTFQNSTKSWSSLISWISSMHWLYVKLECNSDSPSNDYAKPPKTY